MNAFPRIKSLALIVLLALTASVWAQPASPHIGYVYPAGGQQGTTFAVKLAGQYFDGATRVQVSGQGVQAKILKQTKPLTQKQINDLRDRLMDLQKKTSKTAEDKKEIESIREKLAEAAKPVTPVLAEFVYLEVTIAPNAAPGPRELRLQGNTGMSNPVVFEVGQLPEIRQAKEYFDPENPVRRGLARFYKPKKRPPPEEGEITVKLPVVLNSQIMPGEVDRYRFTATRGQQLVFIMRARALIPYLADAVPGWFQGAMTLYDEEGNEVAFSDDFYHQPDPVLAYLVPKDGEYVLEVKDALYRGREDFVYRISVGELPFIRNVFPLGGQANTRTTVTLEGWNLPVSSLTLEPGEMKPGIKRLSTTNKELVSNSVPFQVSTWPEIVEQEPNNTPDTAQKITLPVLINGRISEPGDWDVYQFEGRAKQAIIAEVRARRLDSPLDSILKLTDAKGKVLGINDDYVDKGEGLLTHHADSVLQVTLPEDGIYYLYVSDTQKQGSSVHAYRLRVSVPKPDFELRVTPCSINARPGSAVPITVHAIRKDGFTGEINLFLKHHPVDFALIGAKVPANQDEVRMTLHVPSTAREKPVHLDIEGRATIQGVPVSRLAIPAEEMMQAFIYHHLVTANEMAVTVNGRARPRFPARLLDQGVVRLVPGGTAVVRLAIPRSAAFERIDLVLNDPPEGITLKRVVVNADGALLAIEADGEKAKPGLRGNLIIDAYPEQPKKAGRGPRTPLGTLPAIPFEIRKPPSQ